MIINPNDVIKYHRLSFLSVKKIAKHLSSVV